VSENHLSSMLPATEAGVPSASDKAGRFPFSAVSSAVLVVATGLGMVACGGGGGGSASPASLNVAGQAIKGPVSGGQVCAYTLSSPRQQIACTTTDANASYQLQLPVGTGEVLLEVTGGSYIDEATGQKVALTTPLRTLTKAGGPIENVLMTPFTELAVQRATVGNPGGNLTLVGFQTQIGALETGLGITGLANGKPFGGSSEADQKYLAALTSFSKQQQGSGKSVGDLLTIMGGQIDKCGINSAGATLTVYGNVSLSTAGSNSGGVLIQAANVIEPPPNKFSAFNIDVDNTLPSPCVDNLQINGALANFADLAGSPKPDAWLTASKVELTVCSASKVGLQGDFPQATLRIHAPSDWNIASLVSNPNGTVNIGGGGAIGGGTTISAGGTLNLPGLPPITPASVGVQLDAKGCLQPAPLTGVTIGAGSGGILPGGTTAGSGGGMVVVVGGGGLITN
jgi:hypothetical protein